MKSTTNTREMSYLDILYRNRNKEYGSYELRTHYNKRLTISLLAILGFGLFAFMLSFFYKKASVIADGDVIIRDSVRLRNFHMKPEPKILSDKKSVSNQSNAMPKIVEEIIEKGIEYNALVYNPNPSPDGSNITVVDNHTVVIEEPRIQEPPKVKKPDIELSPSIEAEFPGGKKAWYNFLQTNLEYPDTEEEGTVTVQFIVDTLGKVSQIQAVNGPIGLRNEAISVIKMSKKWIPAQKDGSKVKAYKTQKIVFKYQ